MKPYNYKRVFFLTTFNFLNVGLFLIIFLQAGLTQAPSLSFEHINEYNGLKERFNDFIKKDSRGFVWISSTKGLYRYDGLEVKFYTNDISQEDSMLGRNIQSDFFEDSKGNIWFTTYIGVNCYVRAKDVFTSFQLKNKTGSSYQLGYSLIYLENDNILWLKAENKIFKYNIHTKAQEEIANNIEGMRFTVDVFPDGSVKTIFSCPWLNTQGIEVISVDQNTGKAKKNRYLQDGISAFPGESLDISKALIENDSLIWLFSKKGLLSFNPQKPRDAIPHFSPNGESGVVIDGAFFKENLMFASTKNAGLWIFDRINKRYLHSNSGFLVDPNSISGRL